jgi:hypothetical protein
LNIDLARAEAQLEAEEANRNHAQHERERRRQWAEFFRHRVALHEDLAGENRAKLARLIDAGAGP